MEIKRMQEIEEAKRRILLEVFLESIEEAGCEGDCANCPYSDDDFEYEAPDLGCGYCAICSHEECPCYNCDKDDCENCIYG